MKRAATLILTLVCLAAQAQLPLAPKLKNAWGDIDTHIAPWATNISRPNDITHGLAGRHVSLWASHGRYYDCKRGKWVWQRPNLFGTTEDLFTQTIVVPYLIPMLENAGTYVFTPRERDWQTAEIIVDNDGSLPAGLIIANNTPTQTISWGFRQHSGTYSDDENPFETGTALSMPTTKIGSDSRLIYFPTIARAGSYAVYVSYPYLDDAVDDARYIVYHKGTRTEYLVNQQIGYGTWVYLGTFDFGSANAEARSFENCVILSTASKTSGHIGADAVRFGGGMGNIARGGSTSGLPRCIEGARYYAQWAGAPYSVYSLYEGSDDYRDDINVRSLMTNWLGGGSCYFPTINGLGVPFELTLAVHSDAGYRADATSIYGSLAVATTDASDGLLDAGITRGTSLDLASQLLDNLTRDLRKEFGRWERRLLKDANYSETRIPAVPSAIIETMSHQSFPDMLIGQHPYGKFAVARSLYKTILKYICEQHGQKYVVQPLAPTNFRITLKNDNRIELRWDAVDDPLEDSAEPKSYNIYTAVGENGFDNGQNIGGTAALMTLTPGTQYSFRITACNDGGESFPTETLSAYIAPQPRAEILVVSGFERLAAPFVINNDSLQGFDLDADEGVQRGLYAGWNGRQTCFDKSTIGRTDAAGLGFCGNELAGKFVMGNTFDYAVDHVRAIAAAKQYTVVSCSLAALRNGKISRPGQYEVVDLAFGLQKDDGQLGLHFKTFAAPVRKQLEDYAKKGGAILVSGSFIGSDNTSDDEREFLANVLKLRYRPVDERRSSAAISGLGMNYAIFNELNDEHYAARRYETLSPVDGAICAMQYADGSSAAVGFKGKHSAFTMGFPFECITDTDTKGKLMQGILAYLLKQ